jgi:hypothetical protein
MNRAETIQKLGRAVRDYRGVYFAESGRWKTPPNPGAKKRICRYVEALKMNFVDTLKVIDGFKNFDEMRAWFKNLSAAVTR